MTLTVHLGRASVRRRCARFEPSGRDADTSVGLSAVWSRCRRWGGQVGPADSATAAGERSGPAAPEGLGKAGFRVPAERRRDPAGRRTRETPGPLAGPDDDRRDAAPTERVRRQVDGYHLPAARQVSRRRHQLERTRTTCPRPATAAVPRGGRAVPRIGRAVLRGGRCSESAGRCRGAGGRTAGRVRPRSGAGRSACLRGTRWPDRTVGEPDDGPPERRTARGAGPATRTRHGRQRASRVVGGTPARSRTSRVRWAWSA